MDLAPYIEDLLYEHDCVILPTIGGFIVNYASATIDVVERQVLPPSKTVSFNVKLVSNDGLLAHHIAQKEHMTYKQAMTKLENSTRTIELDLLDKKVVHIRNVGKLYFNSESKLEFLPDSTNFLRDAYGLPVLSSAPILRNKDYLQQAITPAVVHRSKTRTPLFTAQRLAAVAAILLLLFGGPYLYSVLKDNTSQIAGQHNLTTTVTNNKESSSSASASVLPTWDEATNAKDSAETAPHPTAEVVEEETSPPEVPVPADAQDYVIVLGAFGKEKNAQRLAKRLAVDNYLPDVTLKNGLHRVGVQLTCAPDALGSHLTFLREHYNKKAWVLE